MRLSYRRRRALSPVAHHAAKFGERVGDRRVRTKGLRLDVQEAGLRQRRMTGGAAVHHAQFRQPDLLQAALKAPGQSSGVAASPDQSQILFLITEPLPEIILGGNHRQQQQKRRAERAESTGAIAPQKLPRRCQSLPEAHICPRLISAHSKASRRTSQGPGKTFRSESTPRLPIRTRT